MNTQKDSDIKKLLNKKDPLDQKIMELVKSGKLIIGITKLERKQEDVRIK